MMGKVEEQRRLVKKARGVADLGLSLTLVE
jgi:hypothetical protein